MKEREREERSRFGKQFDKVVAEWDTYERVKASRKVAPVHKFGQKGEASWARKFIIAVRGLIGWVLAGKKTYTGKTPQDQAKEPQEH